MTSKLYKKIEVWKNCGHNSAIRFTCYEILGEDKFCVQNADYFYLPVDMEELANANKQLIELFIELAPDERSELYESVVDAISAHEMDFRSSGSE